MLSIEIPGVIPLRVDGIEVGGGRKVEIHFRADGVEVGGRGRKLEIYFRADGVQYQNPPLGLPDNLT